MDQVKLNEEVCIKDIEFKNGIIFWINFKIKELSEEILRVLKANNPVVSQVISRYSYRVIKLCKYECIIYSINLFNL